MCEFFEKHQLDLLKCNKPYQYVGGEFLSENKNFDKSKVKIALAFPDKYEIGISNLGLRVLYGQINKYDNFMADRVYAPQPDFLPDELYALESKRPIKDFDAVGFSLQYEMAYPTVLKMLEMAHIHYKNSDRKEDEPIIIAGGPCTFNPLPMADFIDVFMIGDGEDSIVETCEILERTKGLPRIERIRALCEGENSGRWSKAIGGTVTKRISQLTYESALKEYPIPFSSSVQDRATIEIRRGCGRMCRFCQPGHVTLPLRERPAEDIIKITKELVKNTGYEEYSLLSLSSNDYTNINPVIKELNSEFSNRKISVSLPSQRIDGFNLELAQMVQSVRKSTMTLAPEAGSQRLRDVIKKNISDEEIIDVITTLYANGWSRLKLYFMCGLPTETIDDMDEMANLLNKIKWRCKDIKREKELKHGLDVVCTLSIFVPKPFTPFQWCPQMKEEEVKEHIYRLKDKTKHIKGLKINYHDSSTSQIEAVLTRGDDTLCKYIEALYQKGCYLDAWGEYFKEDIWHETAEELNINLSQLASKQYDIEEDLPWNFINIGVDKEWFKSEYKAAMAIKPAENMQFQPTCQQKCVNCGVCKNLGVKRIFDKPYEPKIKETIPIIRDNAEAKRFRIKLTKTGILKYFSHLDWQNTFFKAVQRTGLDVAYSQGFNPTMKISMGIALPLFEESICELVDIDLFDNIDENELRKILEKVLPQGCKILNINEIKERGQAFEAIDIKAQWAEYKIDLIKSSPLYEIKNLMYDTDKVLSTEQIFIDKRTKKGLTKKTDIKNSIKSYKFEGNSLFIILKTGQGTDIPAIRADVLMEHIAPNIPFNITRIKFFDNEMKEL
ncbi:MAG: TIGR03936 family radical SAM-associated protein [Clostridiaceae bacterium]|jgi:radical SAM-linked protein|nr:TIGR03936 family radical SAM-associated protein [Clostridiaceae bacterium]